MFHGNNYTFWTLIHKLTKAFWRYVERRLYR